MVQNLTHMATMGFQDTTCRPRKHSKIIFRNKCSPWPAAKGLVYAAEISISRMMRFGWLWGCSCGQQYVEATTIRFETTMLRMEYWQWKHSKVDSATWYNFRNRRHYSLPCDETLQVVGLISVSDATALPPSIETYFPLKNWIKIQTAK